MSVIKILDTVILIFLHETICPNSKTRTLKPSGEKTDRDSSGCALAARDSPLRPTERGLKCSDVS